MLKRTLVKFGLWLARLGGWTPYNAGLSNELIESAKLMIAQAGHIAEVSGEYKRREVLRSLINRHPDIPERKLNLAIEQVLEWTS